MSDEQKKAPSERKLELDWDDAADAFRSEIDNIAGEDDEAIFPPDLIDSMIESTLSEEAPDTVRTAMPSARPLEGFDPSEPLAPGSVAPGRTSVPPGRASIPSQAPALPSLPPPPRLELLEDFDDLAPPPPPPAPPPPDQATRERILDRGAKVALGMVRTQRPTLHHRLAAPGHDGQLARVDFLCALAERAHGNQASSLLTSAASLCEQLGDDARAEALYQRASDLGDGSVVAERALSRLAFAKKRVEDSERHLRAEAAAEQVPAARAWALHRLAIVQWLVQRDLSAALKTATEACEAMPSELAHVLLRVRLASAANADDLAYLLLSHEARLDVPALRAVWLMVAGRCLERAGAREVARETYQRALDLDRHAADAALGVARTTDRQTGPAAYAQALRAAASALGKSRLAELLSHRAAELSLQLPELREGAREALAGIPRALAARSLCASYAATDPARALSQAERWAELARGELAASAHFFRARLLFAQNERAAAEAALQAALAADPDGELARLRVAAVSDEELPAAGRATPGRRPSVAPASRMALEPSQVRDELEALASAGDSASPQTVSAVLLDAALESGDRELAETLLGEEARGADGGLAVGGYLALADLALRSGDSQTASAAHALAAKIDTRSCVGVRAATRAAPSAADAGVLFAREASQDVGARAGQSWLRAADATSDQAERLRLLKIAYDAMPLSRSAFGSLQAQSLLHGEHELLAQLHTRRAASERDPRDAAEHLVRAARLRPTADQATALEQLRHARELAPHDAMLRELVVLRAAAAPATRAAALLAQARSSDAPFADALAVSAAAAFEAADAPAEAHDIYASLLGQPAAAQAVDAGFERTARALDRHGLLSDHRRAAVARAPDDDARVRALEALLLLDGDADLSGPCRALLALRPQHPVALRWLERSALTHGDDGALRDVELRLLGCAGGPAARLMRLRLLAVSFALEQRDRAAADELDRAVARHGPDARPTAWLARALASAGSVLHEPGALAAALSLSAESCSDPAEHAALLALRARLAIERGEPDSAAASLSEQLREHGAYPTADELRGELDERLGEHARAAHAFEQAAGRARTPRRAARLWTRAGSLYERAGARTRALAAYRSGATADGTYADLEARIQRLLNEEGNLEALAAHTEASLRAATEPASRVELTRKLSRLRRELGAADAALQLLKSALAEHPDDLGLLRDLSACYAERGDARARAETLIAIARSAEDPAEREDALLALGELYESELPDPARAESAYRRVLQRSPDHRVALERLFGIQRQHGEPAIAEATGDRLLALGLAPDDERALLLSLIALAEQRSDLAHASERAERLIAAYPSDLEALRAVSAHYRRRGDAAATSRHLQAALGLFRGRVHAQLGDAEAWAGLVAVLGELRVSDGLRVARAVMATLGFASDEGAGELRGAGSAGLSELLDDLVFPDSQPASTRLLFRHASEALNKVAPFDPKAVAAERLERAHPLRVAAEEMARRAGMGEVDVLVSRSLPLAFVAVIDAPATQLVVGDRLLASLTPAEAEFLSARALKIARSQASITCRVRPDEMALLLHALIRTELPSHAPSGISPQLLDPLAKRLAKALSRRQQQDLAPVLVELAQAPQFDAQRVYTLASGAGNRAGLLVTGSPLAATRALLKLAGRMPSGPITAAHVVQVEEARELLCFAIRDAHFEARQRAGADQR